MIFRGSSWEGLGQRTHMSALLQEVLGLPDETEVGLWWLQPDHHENRSTQKSIYAKCELQEEQEAQ